MRILEVPLVIASPMGISVRTVFFETLALGASALTLAGTLTTGDSGFRRAGGFVDPLVASGPYLFGISSIVFGIDHFLVLDVIASLVPLKLTAILGDQIHRYM